MAAVDAALGVDQTGGLVRQGRASHPGGTEVDPEFWWSALQLAIGAAGGLDDVAALSIAGQQHGMVCLDEAGVVVRPALLWNDTRSAQAAADLTAELGADSWAEAVGVVPFAAFTIAKLRWLAEHEPDNTARTAAVCLPHDWLTWKLSGSTSIGDLVTDRSDASGTGYFDPRANSYRRDLLVLAFGREVLLPRVAAPAEALSGSGTLIFGPGGGDNAAAGFGIAADNDAVVSLGTSGTVFVRATERPSDPTGTVAGFADLTGAFLPLVCTLNAARVLDAMATVLGVDLATLSDLALMAEPGAEGLTLLPYLEGERTPNLPHSTGAVHGLTLANATPPNFARAAVEGMLSGLAGAWTPLLDKAVRYHGCVWSVAPHSPKRCARSPPPCSGSPSRCPPLASTSPTGPLAERRGCLQGPALHRPGRQAIV